MYQELLEMFGTVQGGTGTRRQGSQGVALPLDKVRESIVGMLALFRFHREKKYNLNMGKQDSRALFIELVDAIGKFVHFASGFSASQCVKFCIITGLLDVPVQLLNCSHIAPGTGSHARLVKKYNIAAQDLPMYLQAAARLLGGEEPVAEQTGCETKRNGNGTKSEKLEYLFCGATQCGLVVPSDGSIAYLVVYKPTFNEATNSVVLGMPTRLKKFEWGSVGDDDDRESSCAYFSEHEKITGEVSHKKEMPEAEKVTGVLYSMDGLNGRVTRQFQKTVIEEDDFMVLGQKLSPLVVEFKLTKAPEIHFRTELTAPLVDPANRYDWIREELARRGGHQQDQCPRPPALDRSVLPTNNESIMVQMDRALADCELPKPKLKISNTWHGGFLYWAVPIEMDMKALAGNVLEITCKRLYFLSPKWHYQLYKVGSVEKVPIEWDGRDSGPYVAELTSPSSDRYQKVFSREQTLARGKAGKKAKLLRKTLFGEYWSARTNYFTNICDAKQVLLEGASPTTALDHVAQQMGKERAYKHDAHQGWVFTSKDDAQVYCTLSIALLDNSDCLSVNKRRKTFCHKVLKAANKAEENKGTKPKVRVVACHSWLGKSTCTSNRIECNSKALFFLIFPQRDDHRLVHLAFVIGGVTHFHDFVRAIPDDRVTTLPKEPKPAPKPAPKPKTKKQTKKRQPAPKPKPKTKKQRNKRQPAAIINANANKRKKVTFTSS